MFPGARLLTNVKTLADVIKERRDALGWSQADLARKAGVSQSTIGNIEAGTRGHLGRPPPSLPQIARALSATTDELLRAAGWLGVGPADPPTPATLGASSSNAQPETARPYPSGNRIPVVGSAQLGDNGHFVELEYPVGHGDGWVDVASRDPNAYALRCRGDSMKPRIQSGEFVVVEPNTEVSPGDEVLVKATDGRVMIKKYLYRREGRVHLISVNEAHPSIALEEREVAAMHYVGAIVKASRWGTG